MKLYCAGTGVAIGPLAMIARDIGYEVVCSDSEETDIVRQMRRDGFTVHVGQDGSAIRNEHEAQPIDWFVHSSALPEDNPEFVYARQVGMKISKRDGFINDFLTDNNLKMLAVAGTHGKTNTTAIIVWALQQAGVPVSYSIGTHIPFGPFGKYEKGSQYFVYEADEFDRNFLHFHPDISIITTIAFDHPDTYQDQADYDLAFAAFIKQSRSVYLYKQDFDAAVDGVHVLQKDDDESSTTLRGKYIRQNARLVLEMLEHEFGISQIDGADYLNRYPGSSRRMEEISERVYSDYAHHPDEIRATMEAGMEISEDVIVVYQPHQNLRQHEIIDAYTDSFEGAGRVYWLPTYLSREQAKDVLKPEEIFSGLTNQQVVEVADMNDTLAEKLRTHQQSGATIIAMSAGNLDAWVRKVFASSESETPQN